MPLSGQLLPAGAVRFDFPEAISIEQGTVQPFPVRRHLGDAVVGEPLIRCAVRLDSIQGTNELQAC